MALLVLNPVAVPKLATARNTRRPALPVPSRRCAIQVRAAANVPGGPTPPDPTPRPPGTPSNIPTPGVFLRTQGPVPPSAGGGSGAGGSSGYGGGRPVSTGGSGGRGGGGPPNLPSGWTWTRVLLTALGIAAAIPIWQYINRRYIFKPEPEHTIAKIEDTAGDVKHRSAVGKAASAVKHATIDPIRDTASAAYQAVKHSDTARTVQHAAEDVKDTADVKIYDTATKAERGASKAKKEVKHAAEDAKAKVDDTVAVAEVKGHEANVKAGRSVQRAGEKVSDVVYEGEVVAGKASKGVLEGLKGAATSVGRKLHVVADATEKGTKKAVNATERAIGVKHVTGPTTSVTERKNAYYAAAGVALGASVLGALYYWDRSGGDIKGKVRKFGDRTREAADTAVDKAKGALKRTGAAGGEPAKPPSSI